MVEFENVHNAKDLFAVAAKSERFSEKEKETLRKMTKEFAGNPEGEGTVYYLKDDPLFKFYVEKDYDGGMTITTYR